ncbi:MAG: sugar phosphate nucleotidyltransferase [Candidatus Woesearchaeota archaeon]|nr:sugar phosphate nucleotidyltransferase [Candidatus Woesearchaeota archaeon]
MEAIILAAGYGMRLDNELKSLKASDPEKHSEIRPFLEGRAKPMIIINGKPVIQYTVENLERAGITRIVIVTNNRYFSQFDEWRDSYKGKSLIKLINDGTNTNESRLGSIHDLLLALKKENISDDVIMVAGDNLFKFEIKDMIESFNDVHTSMIAVYPEKDPERIKKSACVEFDESNLVVNFEEKPKKPRSEWICPAIHIYTADTIRLIKEMKFDDSRKDLIGNIPMMLYDRIDIHAFVRKDKIRFDLGTIHDFDNAVEHFSRK